MIGETLGHYRVEKKLGEGGMGEVFLAVDTTLDRRVALKVLPAEMAASRERLDRFEREAKTVASINHPNIVTIHSVERAGDRRFLTMELVDGQPLGRLIPNGGMELARLFEVAIPLADALSAAHAAGIIHRDLKPSNVMVTREGRVKVLDFGLAKLTHEAPEIARTAAATEPLTREGTLLGTVPYMSPEQVEGRPIDHRSDIFSLGILLYELATGDRPFRGDSSPSLIASILRDEPRSVTELKGGLPRHLGRIIRHCLEKDPERRYQSALDVRNELADLKREVDSGEASGISGVVPAAAPPRAAGRPYFVRGAVGLLALLAVAALGWLATRALRGGGEERPGETVAAPAAAVQPVIVVLPFENLGAADDEYFADGITEEITSRLAAVSGLGVISRSSAMQYKGNRPPTQEIGEALGVTHLLEGTVRWERATDGPSRVRVTPQLIRVADDTSLWSERYDRALDQIFAVQSSIAEEVIRSLDVVLREPERSALGARPTANLEAYQAYLRGLEHWNRAGFDRERFELAGDLFRRASELDPGFLEPTALGVEVYGLLHFAAGGEEELRLAREALERVRASGRDDVVTRIAEGTYLYYVERNWQGAYDRYAAALELQPGNVDALERMAYIRRRQGRLPEAVELLRRSVESDPQNAHKHFQIGDTLRGMRRFEEADPELRRAIALEPDTEELYTQAAENQVAWRGAEGVAAARELLMRAPEQHAPNIRAFLAFADLVEGHPRQALERIADLERSEVEEVRMAALDRLGDAQALAVEATRCISQREGLLADGEPSWGGAFDLAALGHCLAFAGRTEEAASVVAILERFLEAASDDRFGPPALEHGVAAIEARLGRADRAIDRIERLLGTDYQNALTVGNLQIDPIWDPLRGNPRFEALLRSTR